ncbi:DNA internalization-related competence protein ComEC/Rec2 [Senegalia massiliensis]|uniref:DNA internalization-related competence protein ComEC/Rec2 n=1 Tax=Senegalia massiliensis TaxID=1720316 RepID=UPI00102F325D|nr:DNA internalization-related competence protein ComEC/Rec2 [Senegalia massiliensis]
MKRPFLSIVVIYIISILYFYYIQIEFLLSLIFFLGFLIIIFLKKKNIKIIMVLLFVISLGFVSLYYNMHGYKTKDFTDENIDIEIVIKENIKNNEYSSTYNGEIKRIYYNSKAYDIEENTIIRIKNNKKLNYGTVIRGQADLKSPDVNTNSGIFNYKRYLNTQKIYSIVEIDNYIIKGQIKFNILSTIKLKSKEYVNSFLDNSLSEKNSDIIKAIILGDESSLDENYKEQYRELGIAHILAISGLHIGIIAGVILFLLSNLGINYKLSSFITLLFIFTYGYIVGFPASILRSSIILFFIIISRILYKKPDYINIISFVAFILLIYNPLWIFDVGFQLSFIATLSIVILTPIINKKMFASVRFGNTISALISVQIGTIPILIYHFNYISITSLISNIILIPILSFVLISVLLLIILSTLFTNISILFMKIIDKILYYFSYLVDFHQEFLNIIIKSSSWSLTSIVCYYIIIYLIIKVKVLKKLRYRYIKMFFYTYIFLLLLNVISFSQFRWSVNFIDVGQGDSSLIKIKDKTFLIDSGGNIFSDYDIGEKILIPYLLKNNITEIDGVFISHFHEDHVEGLISILKTDFIKVKNIYYNKYNIKNNLYNEIKYLSKSRNIKMINVTRKNVLKVYDVAEFKFYNSGIVDSEENNNTNIISLTLDNTTKVLYMGDAEKALEDKFVKYNSDKYDIIKIGHHGSKTSTTEDILKDINANLAIISVGKNTYGHPNEEVINRLKNNNLEIKRTDYQGNILVENNFRSYNVSWFNKKLQLELRDVYYSIIFVCIMYMNIVYIRLESTKEKIDGI